MPSILLPSFSLFMGQQFPWPFQFSLSCYLRLMTFASRKLVFMLWWAGYSRGKFFSLWKTRTTVGVRALPFSMPFSARKFKEADKPAERGIKALHLSSRKNINIMLLKRCLAQAAFSSRNQQALWLTRLYESFHIVLVKPITIVKDLFFLIRTVQKFFW